MGGDPKWRKPAHRECEDYIGFLPMAWLPDLMQTGAISTKGAVFLYLMRYRFDGPDGEFLACVSRADLAHDLGITETQARNAVDKLQRDLIIRVWQKARRGHPPVYQLMPTDSIPIVTKVRPTDAPKAQLKGRLGGAKGATGNRQRVDCQSHPTNSPSVIERNSADGAPAQEGRAPDGCQSLPGALHVNGKLERGRATSMTLEEFRALQREGR